MKQINTKQSFRQRYGLLIIFIQSTIAMFGSLYYGFYGDLIENIRTGELFLTDNGFAPCELCRYARILIYPISILSLIALIRKERKIVYYFIPLAVLWTLLETYHYVLQKFPIKTWFTCTFDKPCNALRVDYFGFITIPFLCLTAFVVILVVSLLVKRAGKKHEKITIKHTNKQAIDQSNDQANTTKNL